MTGALLLASRRCLSPAQADLQILDVTDDRGFGWRQDMTPFFPTLLTLRCQWDSSSCRNRTSCAVAKRHGLRIVSSKTLEECLSRVFIVYQERLSTRTNAELPKTAWPTLSKLHMRLHFADYQVFSSTDVHSNY